MAAGEGAFSTEELLAWLGCVKPTVPVKKKEIYHVPRPGTLAYQLRLREEAERAQKEKETRELNGFEEEEEEEEEREAEAFYEPHYNLTPDDERAFNFVGDYDPGNPTNPRAQPGDHDYEVEQSVSVYSEFSFEEDNNPRLPIHDYKREILETISENQVRRPCSVT